MPRRSSSYHDLTPRTLERILLSAERASTLSEKVGVPAYTIRRIRAREKFPPQSQTRLTCRYDMCNSDSGLSAASCNGVEVVPVEQHELGVSAWKFCPFCGAVIVRE